MLSQYAFHFSMMQVAVTDMVRRFRLERLMGDTSNLIPASDGSTWESFHDPIFWANYREVCEGVDLDSATAQIDRIVSELKRKPDMRRSELETLFNDLQQRIHDQLLKRFFLYISLDNSPYWENEDRFGEEVSQKFPEATDDIYEACSCYAVGRAGGVVYHCLGVMQAVLFKVAQHLGGLNPSLKITIDLNVDDWGSVVKKIQQAIDGLEQQTLQKQRAGDLTAYPNWKAIESDYNELISDVNAVKKAWRHPHAHFRQTFTLEQAKKILDKVQEFTKHAATLIS
jgi:hypothetical protein